MRAAAGKPFDIISIFQITNTDKLDNSNNSIQKLTRAIFLHFLDIIRVNYFFISSIIE